MTVDLEARIAELEAENRRLLDKRNLQDHLDRLAFIEKRLAFWVTEDFKGPLFDRELRTFVYGQGHEIGMSEYFEGMPMLATIEAIRSLVTEEADDA